MQRLQLPPAGALLDSPRELHVGSRAAVHRHRRVICPGSVSGRVCALGAARLGRVSLLPAAAAAAAAAVVAFVAHPLACPHRGPGWRSARAQRLEGTACMRVGVAVAEHGHRCRRVADPRHRREGVRRAAVAVLPL
eukprot:116405-Chlamydomonas_euryale.AAC.1